MPHALVAIGTSAGGLDALRGVLANVPADLPAAVCIVRHVRGASGLPALLQRVSPLPVHEARDGMALCAGEVYVARSDCHLVLHDAAVLELTRGPRENFARPAIDPLLRSAALAYGPRAIGVILSGRLNDGTAGLFEIKRHGGTAIVQDPASAAWPDMPRSAIEHVAVDHVLALEDIAACIGAVARRLSGLPLSNQVSSSTTEENAMPLDQPVALTCPDCGGALRQLNIGTLTQFRCHIGHRVTLDAMLERHPVEIDGAMDVVLRALNEQIELCRIVLRRDVDDPAARERWEHAMHEAYNRLESLRVLLARSWQTPVSS